MPWRETARDEYRRESDRYASDMTDGEWALIEPFMPPAHRHGRPRTTDLREVVNAVLYIATSGCQWRMLPREFPPVSTVQRYFHDWRDSGLWETIHFHLALQTRELEGRKAQPTAGVPPLSRLRRRIDSQSVKTTESGGLSGFDAGKRVKGRKRHILVDTIGLLFGLVVHGADIQDRDGVPAVPESIRQACPGCVASSPTVPMVGRSCAIPSSTWESGRSRSSSALTKPRALRFCRAAGS